MSFLKWKKDVAKHSLVVLLEPFDGLWVVLTALYSSNMCFELQFRSPDRSSSTVTFVAFDMLFGSMSLNSASHVTAQETDESLLCCSVKCQKKKRFNVNPFNCDIKYVYLCFIFSPVNTHKLSVKRSCFCPLHPVFQQVYFPASSLWTFKICIDLSEISKCDSGLCTKFLNAVSLKALKDHFMSFSSPGHE